LLEFSPIVQALTENNGGELKPDDIWQAFVSEFIEVDGPYQLIDYQLQSMEDGRQACEARITVAENEMTVQGEGTGPIDAFVDGLVSTLNEAFNVADYQEYALNEGKEAQAICILAISDEDTNKYYGVGISQNTTTAAFKSILAATNRKWSHA
jgi:2-isopropylmalate synthase